MITFIKTILGLKLSDEEKELLVILEKSTITRWVSGRGALHLNVTELCKTDKFKQYQKLAKGIVTNV